MIPPLTKWINDIKVKLGFSRTMTAAGADVVDAVNKQSDQIGDLTQLQVTANNLVVAVNAVNEKIIFESQTIASPSGFDGTMKESSFYITLKPGYTPYIIAVKPENYNVSHYIHYFSQANNAGLVYIEHNLNSDATYLIVYILWNKS